MELLIVELLAIVLVEQNVQLFQILYGKMASVFVSKDLPKLDSNVYAMGHI